MCTSTRKHTQTCVVVHECLPVSPPKLRSNGRQAQQGLVTNATPLHLRLDALQMVAPRAAISILPSNGVGTCAGAVHVCPTPNFYKRGACGASGLTFRLAIGWDTLWTATLAVGTAESRSHLIKDITSRLILSVHQTRLPPWIGTALTMQTPKFNLLGQATVLLRQYVYLKYAPLR